MAKVLVITKSDKTRHIVPMMNKPALIAYDRNLPAGQKWKFEEMEEKEAAKLPYIDESYVTAGEAQGKVVELSEALSEKEELIKKLQDDLAKLTKKAAKEETK